MSCSVRLPTSLWRFPLTYPRRPALLNLRPGRYSEYVHRHQCDVRTCRMSLPCRFARWRSLRPHRHRDRQCRPCSSAILPSLRPHPRRHPFHWPAHRLVPLIVTVMSCSVPSADVTVKGVNVSRRPALELRPGRYSEVRPRHRCRCWTCQACRVSVCAVKVASPASSSLIIGVPPVLKLPRCLPSLRPHPRRHPFRWPAHRWCRWSSPWCHALCRLPTSLWRFPLTYPRPWLRTASRSLFRVRPHAIGADVERAVWACRVGLRREGRFARIVITDRQCAARAQAGVFRHFARIHAVLPVPMTGASLVPLIVTVMSCSVPSADVTVKVSGVTYPRRPALELRRGRYSESTSTRHRCDVERAVWWPAVSVCAVRPFARIVIADRQCAARAQAGVFVHFARIHAVTRSDDRRIVGGAVDRHRDVMLCAVCRRHCEGFR